MRNTPAPKRRRHAARKRVPIVNRFFDDSRLAGRRTTRLPQILGPAVRALPHRAVLRLMPAGVPCGPG